MTERTQLAPGDPAPWFRQRTTEQQAFNFDVIGGRWVVLCFLGSAEDAHAGAALEAVRSRPDVFDDVMASFFAVSVDPADLSGARVPERTPGHRVFWDFDGTVSRLYGALPAEPSGDLGSGGYHRHWVVLDPTLRVVSVVPFAPDRSDVATVLGLLDELPPPGLFAGFEVQAPVLVLPNVFDRAFCRRLIGLYETHGGEETGVMRQVDGKTVAVHDHAHKRRRDHVINDADVIRETQAIFHRRVVPMLQRAYQYKATRMERYIVSCYDAEDGAHFRAHRDNTTSGTAHRRFAVSVNLSDDFDGGEVGFPEYGQRRFKPPAGGAVVFSCSLLHSVSKVTRGRRYAFLPFLYDEGAARIREANAGTLDYEQHAKRASKA